MKFEDVSSNPLNSQQRQKVLSIQPRAIDQLMRDKFWIFPTNKGLLRIVRSNLHIETGQNINMLVESVEIQAQRLDC